MALTTRPGPVGDHRAHAGRTATIAHLPALDGLRGAAVLAVLLFHGGHLAGGYLGVDLFFVLSGFLITTLLLVELRDTGGIALGAFWARRARRLLPALVLVLVGVSLYAALIARPVDRGLIRGDGLASLFYVANWHTVLRGSDYWDLSVAPSPLQHTWSLAIEEQFYLLWPLVVLAVAGAGSRSSAPRRLRAACLFGAGASAVLFVGLHATGASDTRVYEGTDTRAVALLLGAALAAHRVERSRAGRPPAGPRTEPVGVIALVLLAAAWAALSGTSTLVYAGLLPACSVAATLVLAAADPRSPVVGRLFSIRGLRWFGLISYGLYLWHWPVFLVLTEDRTGLSGGVLFALRLAVSVAIAVASYVLVEQPIRQQRWSVPKPVAVVGAVVALAVVALVWTTRDAVDPVQLDRQASRRATVTVPGAPRLLVVGDSVGASIAAPALADPAAFGVNPADESIIGCSPFVDGGHRMRGRAGGGELADPPCGARFHEVIEEFDPDVVLGVFGAPPVDSVQLDGRYRRACDPVYDAEVTARYRALADVLTARGAPFVLATVATSSNPWRDRDEARFVACTNRAIRRVAQADPAVQIVDLAAHVCPDGTCDVNEDVDVRADGLHFGGPGGAEVTAWLIDQAKAAAR